MLPETARGLLLLVVAVLPGLTYTLAFERKRSDRRRLTGPLPLARSRSRLHESVLKP